MVFCTVCEICRNLAQIAILETEKRTRIANEQKKAKCQSATVTWQHDNTSDLLLYTLSFGIHSKFYPPDLKYAVVSQAHIHFAENLKNCVVMWCK